MDLTIEAIENDLRLAEQTIGRPGYDLHLARAKIRATLMQTRMPGLAQPGIEAPTDPLAMTTDDVDIRVLEGAYGTVYVVPFKAEQNDRLVIAHQIIPEAFPHLDPPRMSMERPEIVIVDSESDDEVDIFADARKERKK